MKPEIKNLNPINANGKYTCTVRDCKNLVTTYRHRAYPLCPKHVQQLPPEMRTSMVNVMRYANLEMFNMSVTCIASEARRYINKQVRNAERVEKARLEREAARAAL